MPASWVAICNRALDYLGQASITSLEDDSVSARACKRQYEASRDVVLRGYPWNCATARASLAAEATAPSWGFSYSFVLPPDCIRVLEVEEDIAARITWRIEGRRILSDQPAPLRIRYIRRVTDPGELDDLCGDAISARLAADVARTITGNTSDVQLMMQRFEMIRAEARRIDGTEASQDDRVTADDWLASRIYGAGR